MGLAPKRAKAAAGKKGAVGKAAVKKRPGATSDAMRRALRGAFLGSPDDGNGKLWKAKAAARTCEGVTRGPSQRAVWKLYEELTAAGFDGRGERCMVVGLPTPSEDSRLKAIGVNDVEVRDQNKLWKVAVLPHPRRGEASCGHAHGCGTPALHQTSGHF
jgi:hypothetical protein